MQHVQRAVGVHRGAVFGANGAVGGGAQPHALRADGGDARAVRIGHQLLQRTLQLDAGPAGVDARAAVSVRGAGHHLRAVRRDRVEAEVQDAAVVAEGADSRQAGAAEVANDVLVKVRSAVAGFESPASNSSTTLCAPPSPDGGEGRTSRRCALRWTSASIPAFRRAPVANDGLDVGCGPRRHRAQPARGGRASRPGSRRRTRSRTRCWRRSARSRRTRC